MSTKGDLINNAYNHLRIRGITVDAGSEDLSIALDVLETMAEEYKEREICTGYAFEDDPDFNTPHNVKRKFWFAYEITLAFRLIMAFGKQIPQSLMMLAEGALSYLYAATATPQQTQYPNRQPIGEAITYRYNRFQHFYKRSAIAPNTCRTIKMYKDDVNNFVEHFDSYLDLGESVSSYTIEADTGLTIVSDSLSSPDISYTIKADGSGGVGSDLDLQVKIVATTSNSRVETRIINFQVFDSDVID